MVLWLKSISIFNIDENIRYFITIELTFTLHLLKGGVGGLYGPKILAFHKIGLTPPNPGILANLAHKSAYMRLSIFFDKSA